MSDHRYGAFSTGKARVCLLSLLWRRYKAGYNDFARPKKETDDSYECLFGVRMFVHPSLGSVANVAQPCSFPTPTTLRRLEEEESKKKIRRQFLEFALGLLLEGCGCAEVPGEKKTQGGTPCQ